ncbi:MAG: nucleotide pyrophosphatase [Acidobacteria bacterium]|nr:MAG: nucleotide pyrophosphatase [Acidobacteriota bacterium]
MRRDDLARGALLLTCALYLRTHHGHSSGVLLCYVGPGPGFAFLGSLLSLLVGFLLNLFSLLSWPVRIVWRLVRRRGGFRKAHVKKVIFLGLDGLDPRLAERFMAEGKLPNLARLKEQGSYSRLRTTFPALSPVAWSTFATGVNPAKHNIFDFLNRNMKSYVPELATAKVYPPERVLKLGRLRIPLSGPHVEMRRKSVPFWTLLGKQHIGSTIIRVPITFPPDKFNGRLLSAMSTPDLRGTQGSFSQFTTRVGEATFESGSRYPLKRTADGFEGSLEGPEDILHDNGGPLAIPFRIRIKGNGPVLEIQDACYPLASRTYTPWVRLIFKAALGIKVNGIARFLVTETGPHFSLYVSPIQIDPEKPALPISHPSYYAAYLAKLLGTYSTLGMAEDTWALNEGVIDEDEFLEQSYLLMEEREAMFRNALEKTRRGVVACVFDTSDRVQHMFYRYLSGNAHGASPYTRTIEDLYQRVDKLVGLALEHADPDTVVFVLSDHGFASFRRGINLNAWLRDNGYLKLENDATESGRYFKGVDWGRTRAYTLGLGGLYLNLKGREAQGTVKSGAEAEALKQELIGKLTHLRDEEQKAIGIRNVYASNALYRGPYLAEAPDLIIGYNDGYRTSWDAAVGKVTARVFEDNRKAWSGDHSVDPLLVPGVLFSNREIEAEDPGIEDMAPTALELFGVERPAWMEGRPVFQLGMKTGNNQT